MDKEMMAKVNEVLKANGRRELSLDEMDKVSGGNVGGITVNGIWTSEDEINEMWGQVVNAVGYDVAGDLFCDTYGIAKYEATRVRRGDASDQENMALLIDRLMKIYDNIDEYGKGH